MYKIVKKLNFCYAHRLLNYEGKCAHLHGHNAVVDVELTAELLNSQSLVLDFVEIKNKVKTFLDEELDHKLILSEKDPLASVLQKMGEPVVLISENPSAEVLAKLIFHETRQRGLPVSSIRLWETPSSYAEYSE